MHTPETIRNQVDKIVGHLVEVGLASDQNFAIWRDVAGGNREVTFPQANHVSIALKDQAYSEIYKHLARERAYNVKMPDGALIQMMYVFDSSTLLRHRLAFFPAPDLEEFQNNPEIYLEDEIYADVIARNIVPFPIRFDYAARVSMHKEVEHAKSHLTLGQYKNCRIPVTAPLTPFWFIDFVLRNFYHTAFHSYANHLPKHGEVFEDSIAAAEKKVIHIQIPFEIKTN